MLKFDMLSENCTSRSVTEAVLSKGTNTVSTV